MLTTIMRCSLCSLESLHLGGFQFQSNWKVILFLTFFAFEAMVKHENKNITKTTNHDDLHGLHIESVLCVGRI